MEGHSRGHLRLRQETVQYMMSHRQDFEPFVEDDVPFAQHCKIETKCYFHVKMLWDAQVFDGMPVILESVSLKILSLIFLSVVVFLSVSNLSQPGTFAGNDAIVAFARSQQLKVVIHQLNTPLWEVVTSMTPYCPYSLLLWARDIKLYKGYSSAQLGKHFILLFVCF